MSYEYFSHNGIITPIGQAVVPVANLEYSYGFGVYESIRVSNGFAFFIDEHCQRLMKSADAIELEHDFQPDFIKNSIETLIDKNKTKNCNIKLLLIGGKTNEQAQLFILCLNPYFPDRQLYKQGATCVTYQYERDFPQAKTLNMLPSYIAYKHAKAAGAYDALLINRNDEIIEGTRTNFFAVKNDQLFTAPEAMVLPGVTRQHVIEVAIKHGIEVIEETIGLSGLSEYDGAFVTSTSSKILPLKAIDQHEFGPPNEKIKKLMAAFDDFLQSERSSGAGTAA